MTMTGTLAPDGTIGVVSGVPEKVRAAHAAGFTSVLVPFGTRTEPGGEDPVAVGHALGIDVREVRDLPEAYRAFTGIDLAPHGASPLLSASATAVARKAAERLNSRVTAWSRSPLLDAADRVALSQRLDIVNADRKSTRLNSSHT